MLRLFLSFIFTALWLPANGDGNVTCSGTGLDWYMNIVGESPCTTYEKLRQICNPQYQVGTLNPNTPPDTCNDEVSDCCCNHVAFGLSMLCLNCQQGTGSAGNGFNAGQGAYQDYTTSCTPVTNESLPSNVDTAVCDKGIKIIDDLYIRLYWGDGSWFYVFSEETISTDVAAADGDAFTHCASEEATHTSSSSTTSTTGSTSSSSSGSSTVIATSGSDQNLATSSSHMSKGAIGGITVGAIAIIIIAVIALWLCFRSRKRSKQNLSPSSTAIDPFSNRSQPQAIDPFLTFSQQPSLLGYIPQQMNLVREPSRSTTTDQSESDAPLMRHIDAGPVRLGQRMSGSLPPPAYGEQI